MEGGEGGAAERVTIYVHVCVHTYIYIYIHMYIHICECCYIYTYKEMHRHTNAAVPISQAPICCGHAVVEPWNASACPTFPLRSGPVRCGSRGCISGFRAHLHHQQ